MRRLKVNEVGWIAVGWIISIFAMTSGSSAAVGTWMTKADMPTARAMSCAAVVEEKIYVIGGALGIDSTLAVVEVYDPETDVWEPRSSMPAPRGAGAACVVDGIIYVFGGGQVSSAGTSTVFAYNPVTDGWTSKADMPTPRQAPAACAVDGIVYVIGGLVQSTSPTAVVETYDPKTDTWKQKTPMPSAVGIVSGAVVDGTIYVCGGGQAGGSGLPNVFAYDPDTDTWARKADMPTARMGLCTASVDGIIYTIGGTPYGGGPGLSAVEVYNPTTDSWALVTDMPTPRKYPTCGVVGGKLHIVGGVQSAPLATLEVYDLTPPPPDFNGDGNIDGKDVLILAEAWGTEDAICDIAPSPFGDGVVEVQDLIALAEYIGREVDDPTLVAHWALDETEGLVAHDSAGGNNGTVIGTALWRPTEGIAAGALELDGVTSIVTDFVLDPQEGPFSVFTWVKGGASNQGVVSQRAGADWLALDPATGALMTELRSGSRTSTPLWSDAVVTDGDWHRAAFTWDGTHRRLYVDDTLVAEDTDVALAACDGGLNIGCGKSAASNTFFTGLIDDVRIYNRAVRP